MRGLFSKRPAGGSTGGSAGGAGARRGTRGAAELSVVALTAALIGGALFGSGVTQTALNVADGLTWLSDDPTGQVIQVNPASGEPEVRLNAGDPGDDLDVSQYDGLLYVLNRADGSVTSIDPANLTIAGAMSTTAGGASDLLEHGGSVYLVDREQGTIAAIDQSTTDQIGTLWVSPTGLADANIDGRGRVWALDPEGLLTQLRWSNTDLSFVSESTRQIDNSGEDSVVVGHERGVTVFGPENGIIVQVGTGHDLVANAPDLRGELVAPRRTPDGLVAVAAAESGTVVIVGEQAHDVDVAAIGCPEPGRPEIFRGMVYVPCLDAGKVLRLNAEGGRAATDIVTPGLKDAELVLDDGSLFINVPESDQGVLVHADGSFTTITRRDEEVESITPTTTAPPVVLPPPPPPPPTPSSQPPSPKPPTQTASPTTPSPTDSPTVRPGKPTSPAWPITALPTIFPTNGPSPSSTSTTKPPKPKPTHPTKPTSTTSTSTTTTTTTAPTTPPTLAPLSAPTGVTAKQTGASAVQVTWDHTGTPAEGFAISRTSGGTLGQVGGDIRQATVNVPVGTTDTFVVTASRGLETAVSAPSNTVSVATVPGAATNITGTVTRGAYNAGTVAGTATWTAADPNGSPLKNYVVKVIGGVPETTQTLEPTKATVDFTVKCADVGTTGCDSGSVKIQVYAINGEGAGAVTTKTIDTAPKTPVRLPAAGQGMVDTYSGDFVDEFGTGSTELGLAPPADWASFTGTCTYTHTGNLGGAVSGNIACNAASLSIQLDVGPARKVPRSISQSVVFHATNTTGTVDSAAFGWDVQQEGNGVGPCAGGGVCPTELTPMARPDNDGSTVSQEIK